MSGSNRFYLQIAFQGSRYFAFCKYGSVHKCRITTEIKGYGLTILFISMQDFHVSCLPNEGLSTVESHRYLHLTKATIQYLTENFACMRRIAGKYNYITFNSNCALKIELPPKCKHFSVYFDYLQELRLGYLVIVINNRSPPYSTLKGYLDASLSSPSNKL